MSGLISVLHPLLGEGDPLYVNGVHWVVFLIVVIKVLVAFGALMVSVMLMIWFERKVISDMQAGSGPTGPDRSGSLQTLADGIKLFFKEDLIPDRADRFVFKLAPYLSILPAFLSFAIVPVGGVVTIAGHTFELQVADPPMGILFLLAMSSISVYGVMLAGWSSGSKYPLLGSVRASAQMISYEAALGHDRGHGGAARRVAVAPGPSSKPRPHTSWQWNLIRLGIVPFFIFMIAITAEINRPPFDLVEAEQELVGGFNTEYSSIRFALFFMAEFMNTITMSAIIVTLFLGGPDGPTPHVSLLSWLVAHPVVPGQDPRLPVHLRVAAGRAAPPALRPAHGPGLEGPHPPVARVAARRGRLPGGRWWGLGHGPDRGGRGHRHHPGASPSAPSGRRPGPSCRRSVSACGPGPPNPPASPGSPVSPSSEGGGA